VTNVHTAKVGEENKGNQAALWMYALSPAESLVAWLMHLTIGCPYWSYHPLGISLRNKDIYIFLFSSSWNIYTKNQGWSKNIDVMVSALCSLVSYLQIKSA
jgi:hypothetical protein